MQQQRNLLLEIYAYGLASVHGEQAVYQALVVKGQRQPQHVVAIGKAAEAMFRGALRYGKAELLSGLIITKHAHISADFTAKLQTLAVPVTVLETAHPVPDDSSLAAGQTLLAYLQALPADEPVLFLLSGGASSLVEVLAEGWTLAKLQTSTQALLANGSSIAEINTMRRQLSCIKGGKLWQFLGEHPVQCLLISDVPGDDPHVIGSGLLFPAPPNKQWSWQIVASNQQLLHTLAQYPCELPIHIMPDFLEGDAVTTAQQCIAHLRNSPAGIYLWGAETTVQLPAHPGRGGRNQHFALAAALALQPDDTIYLLAAGTDGTDGMTDDAGALVDPATCQRGQYDNLDPHACLQNADAGTFLAASNDLISTGATGTNVMDVVIGIKW